MHSFTIRAHADPQTLPRVIGQLGRRWVTPLRLDAGLVGGEMLIRFDVDDLSNASAEMMGATLRSSVLVHEVVLCPAAIALS
jgi:hypothetical protein